MDDPVFGGSEWDDEVGSGSGAPQFGQLDKSLVDELANTFKNAGLEDEHEEETQPAQDETQGPGDGTEGPGEPQDDEESPHEETEQQREAKEQAKRALLSSLTAEADSGFIPQIKSPKKDEALFTDSVIPAGDADASPVTSPAHITSPSRLAARRQNLFRASRLRRVPLKDESPTKVGAGETSETGGTGESSTSDPLGPLGGGAEHDDEAPAANAAPAATSTHTQLLHDIDGPLFDINRTPLSPLKHSAQGLVPAEVSQTQSAGSAGASASAQPDPTPASPEQREDLHITVEDPTKVGDLTSAHIVYSVRTNTESELLRQKQSVVSRRYRDFRWLYRQLQSTHPGRIIPPPPDKQAVGRFNEDFIESRRFALERMLVKIAANPVLQKDPDFIMFLQSERFSSEAREREKIAGTSSTFTAVEESSDGLLDTSTASGNGTGFLSSIGGAFSFQPKLTEPDDFFKEKKQYIESLDQQFKIILRHLETVVIQRHDLSTITEEFANILLTMSDLEVSATTTKMFEEFSSTQLRIKELLDRLSLQDILTLETTLDEYQRLISSVKTTFNQRDKILLQLISSENDLKKKRASLDKNSKFNKSHKDKIQQLQNELAQLEGKNELLKKKFDNISKTIKQELEGFEKERIVDFRNSIEIFLESTIESQKEAVELWETFYNNCLNDV